jgi:hypothetical protein
MLILPSSRTQRDGDRVYVEPCRRMGRFYQRSGQQDEIHICNVERFQVGVRPVR